MPQQDPSQTEESHLSVTTASTLTLRQRREALWLSRRELAALASCSEASLAQLELGLRPRRSRVLLRLEATLDGLEATP